MLPLIEQIVRGVIALALLYATIVALTYWGLRQRKLAPFGAWARFVRRFSEPIIKPLERRVVRTGGNPQDAPLWLLGVVVVGGLVLIALTRWLIGAFAQMSYLAQAGPQAWTIQIVIWVFNVLIAALFVRVIVSWFGISPHKAWMRPVVVLTDWLLEPLRRVLPPVGPFDLSPLVAYFLLVVARGALLRLLAG